MNEAFQVKRLGKQDVGDFQQLISFFKEVFDMQDTKEAGEIYLEQLLEKPGFIVYAALTGDEIVGGLTAYELPMYYAEGAEVYIYDIAVKSEFQRKGLGKELLLALKNYCQQNGIKLMFVEAHEEDSHAIDFYHSTGGKAEKVVHFNYFLDRELGNE